MTSSAAFPFWKNFIKLKTEEENIMLKNIANLIKVKTIVTLVVLAIFAVLALRGDIAPDNVMVVVSTVVAFYFGTQHEKQAPVEIQEGLAVLEPTEGDATDSKNI